MKLRAALVLLLCAMSAVPANGAPATATPGLTVEIIGMGPTLPTTGTTVTVTVQVSNSGDIAITDLQARFLVSVSALNGRSQIPDVISGRSLPTYRLVEPIAPTRMNLASGASTIVTIRATPKQLGLSASRPGAYVFGVHLDGTAAGRPLIERRITFLPWLSGRVENRLGVITVWTLTAPPSLGVDGVFIDDALARSVSPGGRLRLQLDAMRQVPQAVWLVDPVLAESVQALTVGARIAQADGGVRATTDAEMQAASQWLADLRAATATGTLGALPMGDLDIRAGLKFGRLSVVRNALGQASAKLATVMQLPDAPLITPLYGGAVTRSSWKFLHRVGAVAAVVSDQGYPATQRQYTPSSAYVERAFGRPVIVTDHVTSATPVTSGLAATANRQAFAAQLLMTYLERPNSRRVVAIAIPPSWTPDPFTRTSDVLNAPWISHASIGAISATGDEPRDVVITVATQAQRLQNVDLGRAVYEQRRLAHLTQDETFTATVNDAVIGTLSRWWTARGADDRYSAITIAKLRSLAESVRVITRGEIVFGGEKGVVPVTVANGLPVAIDIGLRATGYPGVRVQPTIHTPIHLNAGKRVSVEIATRVTGSGDAYLGLQLVAGDKSAIDGPVILTVRSAAYARVAGYLVIVAFAALLLLVGANTVKRIRNRGEQQGDE